MNNSNTLLFCPICNQKYSNGCVRTVADRKETVIVHITCSACRSTSLAIISNRNDDDRLISVGMLIDLGYDEIIEMIKKGPITADEVLEINQMISTI